MTEENGAAELVEKSADGDLVREMLAFAAERIMDAEVEVLTGAAKGVRTALRENLRNGYRDRDWDTRAPEGSRWRSRSFAREATSRASSSRGGRPRGTDGGDPGSLVHGLSTRSSTIW